MTMATYHPPAQSPHDGRSSRYVEVRTEVSGECIGIGGETLIEAGTLCIVFEVPGEMLAISADEFSPEALEAARHLAVGWTGSLEDLRTAAMNIGGGA
jgi:hypothetical protein